MGECFWTNYDYVQYSGSEFKPITCNLRFFIMREYEADNSQVQIFCRVWIEIVLGFEVVAEEEYKWLRCKMNMRKQGISSRQTSKFLFHACYVCQQTWYLSKEIRDKNAYFANFFSYKRKCAILLYTLSYAQISFDNKKKILIVSAWNYVVYYVFHGPPLIMY